MDRPSKPEIDDLRKQALIDAAYEASMRNTPPAPMRPASAPMRPASAPRAKAQSAAVTEMLQEVQDAKARKKISAMGYAKGGSVSASKRADGCATKGKTRGKML
jgi:hypothetical protein